MRKNLSLLIALCISVTAMAQVQSPEQFLGYKIGTRYTPHWKVVSYFQHVAANAPKTVKLQQYGQTNEGRPLLVAFISSEENMGNLEAIRVNNLRLANLTKDKAAPNENAPAIVMDGVIVKNALYWRRQNIRGEFGSSAVALHYEPSHFENTEAVVLVGGFTWDEPFKAIRYVSRADESNKVTTQVQVSTPIIMLGETYEQWASSDFYLSTALSPNASRPENRKVMIFGDRLAAEDFHFQVFNRWGDLVFETNSLDEMKVNGWDGQGRRLSTGTYPYRLTGLDKTGRPFERKGVITIVH